MNMHNSPSRHLTEDVLYEYLDQALSGEQLAEIRAHLDVCQSCERRLAEYSAFFSTIENLPDQLILRDLTPDVLTAIKRKAGQMSVWWWLLAIQGILALALIAFTAPAIINSPLTFSLLENGKGVIAELSSNLSTWLREWSSLIGMLEQQTSQLFAIRIPISLNLPVQSILWLLLITTVTWIVGNSILLRPQLKRN